MGDPQLEPEAQWSLPQLEPIDWSSVERAPFQRAFLDPSAPAEEGADERRKALRIHIEDAAGALVPPVIDSFDQLGVFPEYLLWALKEHGFLQPTPIQAQAIPLVLSGHNVIGIAQTGSGKTLAFLLPAIVHIEAQEPLLKGVATPIALMLAPTRELAVQICDEALKVVAYSNWGTHTSGICSSCVFGGVSKRDQTRQLSYGVHIVVATPGRLLDFVASKVLSLQRVTYFVLDEADRMLDMGFQGDVAALSEQIRPERQLLFFSATWSSAVQVLAHGLCDGSSSPVRICAGQEEVRSLEESDQAELTAREGIEQEVVVIDAPDDPEQQQVLKRNHLDGYLNQVLAESEQNKVLVFVSQKELADDLCEKLAADGFQVDAMHGGRSQQYRLWTLDQFRKGHLRLMVATDVLGRGIDIPDISHVVVYDMGYIEDYVHRIGRTARGVGSRGKALVFFEYYYKCPGIAADLIRVLENSKQPVPEELRRIADEVARGKRTVFTQRKKWGNNGGWHANSYSKESKESKDEEEHQPEEGDREANSYLKHKDEHRSDERKWGANSKKKDERKSDGRNWETNGYSKRKDEQWSDDAKKTEWPEELRSRPNLLRKQPCFAFARGFCKHGDNCKYVHEGSPVEAATSQVVNVIPEIQNPQDQKVISLDRALEQVRPQRWSRHANNSNQAATASDETLQSTKACEESHSEQTWDPIGERERAWDPIADGVAWKNGDTEKSAAFSSRRGGRQQGRGRRGRGYESRGS